MSNDPRDFGPVPAKAKSFKLPAELPKARGDLLALVAARGGFPPRAARWFAVRELQAMLSGSYPFESSTINAVRVPRQITSEGDMLTLAADRRVAYYADRAKKQKAKVETDKADTDDKVKEPPPKATTPKAATTKPKAAS